MPEAISLLFDGYLKISYPDDHSVENGIYASTIINKFEIIQKFY